MVNLEELDADSQRLLDQILVARHAANVDCRTDLTILCSWCHAMRSTLLRAFLGAVILSSLPSVSVAQWEGVVGPDETRVNTYERSGRYILAATESGVFKSKNRGKSWTEANSGLPSDTFFRDLVVVGNDVFVLAYDSSLEKTLVRRSANNGLTWVDASTGLPDNLWSLVALGDQLFVMGRDANYSVLVYRSANQGGSWQPVNRKDMHHWPNSGLEVNGASLFAFSFDEIYKSADLGESWVLSSSEEILAETWIEENSCPPDEISLDYIAAEGESLIASASVLEDRFSAPLSGDYDYHAHYQALFRSDDDGKTWALTHWEREDEAKNPYDFYDLLTENGALFAATWRGVLRWRAG